MCKLQPQFLKFIILSLSAVLALCDGVGGSKNPENPVIRNESTMDELFTAFKEINKKLTEIATDTSQLSKEVGVLKNQNSELNRKLEEYRKDEYENMSNILLKFSSTCDELNQFEEKQTTILKDFRKSLENPTISMNVSKSINFSNQLKLALDESSTSYSSCDEAIKYNGHSGVYSLRVLNSEYSTFKVYCLKEEMFGGSAWTLIQRRDMNSGHSIDFNRTWEEYRNGFGDPEYDYWLGLDKIFILTNLTRHYLWERSSNGNVTSDLAYYNFTIADASENFRITSLAETDIHRFVFHCLDSPFNTFDFGNTTWVEQECGGGGFWGPCDTNYNSQVLRNGKWQIHQKSPARDAVYVHLAIRQVPV